MGCAGMTRGARHLGAQMGSSTIPPIQLDLDSVSPPIRKPSSPINHYGERHIMPANLNPYAIQQGIFLVQCGSRLADIRTYRYNEKSNCLTTLYHILADNAQFVRNFRTFESWAMSAEGRLPAGVVHTFEPLYFAVFLESMVFGLEYHFHTYGWEALPPHLAFDFSDEYTSNIGYHSESKTLYVSVRWMIATIFNITRDRYIRFGYVVHSPDVYVHAVFGVLLFTIEEAYLYYREEQSCMRNLFQRVLQFGERSTTSLEIDDMYLRALLEMPQIKLVNSRGYIIDVLGIGRQKSRERSLENQGWLKRLKLDKTFADVRTGLGRLARGVREKRR